MSAGGILGHGRGTLDSSLLFFQQLFLFVTIDGFGSLRRRSIFIVVSVVLEVGFHQG